MKRYWILALLMISLYAGAQSVQTNIFSTDLMQRQGAEPVFASNYVQTNVRNSDANAIQYQNYNPPPQQKFSEVNDNVGDALENKGSNFVEQIASLDIPAVQFGGGNLSLNLNLPKVNFRSIKLTRKSSSGKLRKSQRFVNKWRKLSRGMYGRFSFERKLKIKVDNCFKW